MAANEELHGFVRDALGKGIARTEVEAVLTRSGWGAAQVRGALDEFADVAFPIPVPRPRPSLDARDAFLYFVLFSTLYVSAFHFGNLIFDFINRAFPDPAFSDRYGYAASAVRWSIASLIIAVPVLSVRVQPHQRRDPHRSGQAWIQGAPVADVPHLVHRVSGAHRRLHHARLQRPQR